MKTAIRILIISTALFLTGCEDVIHVDLDTAPPRLVIDASIDWVKNTTGNEQKIKLSTTTGYYSPEFPTVSGATIFITNASDTVFDFIENPGTGEYICTNFEPVLGATYELTIVLNGETYTATETFTGVSELEDTIEQDNEGGFGGDEVELTYYYQDDGSQDNYYLHSVISPRVAFPEYELVDDENSQGNRIPETYSHEDLKPGDIVNIKLYGISKRYYQYFNKLLLASGNDDSPFATTPTAVRGNVVNQTDSNNFPFGYFRLSEISTKDYTIQ